MDLPNINIQVVIYVWGNVAPFPPQSESSAGKDGDWDVAALLMALFREGRRAKDG